ncbi:MAG: hypothetical protein KGL35_17520 [Bradyrhizobium sp.]|nr:hypothetical protein [Bradyrhizobium sp.]
MRSFINAVPKRDTLKRKHDIPEAREISDGKLERLSDEMIPVDRSQLSCR